MIKSKSPTVLYINKLSVLLVSFMLLLLWAKFEFTESVVQSSKNNSVSVISNNHSKASKYTKTLSVNPFLRIHDEIVSSDVLATITNLQITIPPFSSLKTRLHGIVYQHNQDSYAMISIQGAIQEIFSINGEISEGLYLTKVSRKQVEVDYFGEQHVLLIDNSRRALELSKAESEQTANLEFHQQIELLEVDKQRNPIRLFMIRRPYAVYHNGEFQGYKIMPGSNTDQFKRLGFKSGDIITYLNGKEFTGPGMKEFVIQQLTHAMHIDLTVMRGNQELSINYGF
ncbi:MAG: type II secretion system protein N [Cocleimonas sp.]